MKAILNPDSLAMVKASYGWPFNIRFSDPEISALEGTPKEFERLYDELNASALKLTRSAEALRAILNEGKP